jgi:mRNA interferase MazF
MHFGEIFLVNFDPAVGAEFQKARPALIIQSDEIHSSLITIVPLSSKITKKEPDDLLIRKDARNRLFCDSLIKVHQIASFDPRRFIHQIGVADALTLKKVQKYLKKHFDLVNCTSNA